MQKSNPTLWIGLAVVAIIAIANFGILPQNAKLKEMRLQVAAKREEADILQKKVESLRTLQAQFASRKKEIDRLKLALPSSAKPEEIFVMLESIAGKSGATLLNIQPDASSAASDGSTPTATDGTADISVSVVGDFNAITRFTQELNKNIRPIIINDTVLAAEDSDESGGRVSATYNLGFLVANATPTGAIPVGGIIPPVGAPALPQEVK